MFVRRRSLLVLCLGLWVAGCGAAAGSAASDGEDAADDTAADVALADDATPDVNPYVGKCSKGPSICDDGNPCTIDDCDPAQGCITTIKVCADSDPCTIDRCDVKSGDCLHDPDPCDDGNACTTGSCVAGSGCAFAAVDCSDGDACTSDGCTPASGCLHATVNCDDGKTCTTDSCDKSSGCVHSQPAAGKCCEADLDCDDNNVCTAEHCVAGLCNSQGIFGCCKADADCNDANACTADTCNVASGVCSNAIQANAGCCQSDAECNDQKPCTLDHCIANACAHELTCCQTANDCSLYATAIDSCGEATCTSAGCGVMPVTGGGCCTPLVKSSGFEASDTWEVKTLPASAGAWMVESGKTPVKSGSGALVYRSAPAVILGGGATALAKMAPVHLPEGTGVTLQFQFQSQLNGAEVVRLRALTGLGAWVIWQGSSTAGSWQTVSVNLSGFAGRSGAQILQLQWEVVPKVGIAGSGTVVAVDDVHVTSTCAAINCQGDATCNDGLSATKESCANKQCVYVTSPDYCESAPACDDGNACTADSCLPSQYQCNHGAIANCCLNVTQCDDKNVCTTDACNFSHQCMHTKQPGTVCCNGASDCDDANICTQDMCPVVGLPCAHTQPDANCCMSAKDCNDGAPCTVDTCAVNQCGHKYVCCVSAADCNDGDDVCTNDSCVNLFCEHTPTGAPGCCVPIVWQQDMEGGIPAMWTVNASSANAKWQWSQKKAHGGTGALWYGNAATGDFSDGTNATTGSLQSTAIDLPANNTIEFSMWVWLDTEMGPPYDELTLSAMVDGKSFMLWTKHKDVSASGAELWQLQTWYQARVNLSAFAGKSVVLSLKFDTVDGVGNNGQGVFVDDMQLSRSCAPFTCNTPQDCDDKLPDTQDGCAAGTCTYAY